MWNPSLPRKNVKSTHLNQWLFIQENGKEVSVMDTVNKSGQMVLDTSVNGKKTALTEKENLFM